MIVNHCNHCDKDFEMRIHGMICVKCFVAGHRGPTCGEYCKVEPEKGDPRVAKALEMVYRDRNKP